MVLFGVYEVCKYFKAGQIGVLLPGLAIIVFAMVALIKGAKICTDTEIDAGQVEKAVI